ncbi:hypothetical protein BV25DRAFT_1797413 [Artomyces pyxidatus]|uniref:Uncharacterized protein n=1 Tax=Artomyces pyxidatus TaxID=48021 RepID=A0ACB8TBS8_9AGAM|nr:hypothetical protein BV25DRAFT_1797413 [Artomyces pyxidatus]
MSAPVLNLLIIVYGSSSTDPVSDSRYGAHQRRLELELRPKLPMIGMSPAEISTWTSALVRRIHPDVKHSQRWHCEFCDKLALETSCNFASWSHLNPPKVNVYFHGVCNSIRGPCYRMLKKMNKELNAQTGMVANKPSKADLAAGPSGPFPAAASCAQCHTVTGLDNMKKCSGCQITRYCGSECQTSDWTRHKEFCKMKKEVKWVWN